MTATTLSGVVYVIVLAVVVVVALVAFAFVRRRAATAKPGALEPPQGEPARAQAAAPMTGLESALAQVTDREGRPIGERIDAEAEAVDELRIPDDTGPVLRRALDRVEHHDEPDSDAEPS